MIRTLSKRLRSFGGRDRPDSSRWAPVLIHVAPPFAGKSEFIESLNEPVATVTLNEMRGLYESVPLKDALIIWQGHASNEMKEKYKSIMKRLQSSKVKEQMMLTLYFNKIINRKQLVASLSSILEGEESFVLHIIDAIKELSVGGHRPQMVCSEVKIMISESIPTAMNEALKKLKEACKYDGQLVVWDDSNLTPTYAYKDLLAIANKYERVVRFVRWGQELPVKQLNELIKLNVETYLRTGEYITTRRLVTAFKMAATSMKNVDMMMTHEDFARLSGYCMDPSGRVYPQTMNSAQQEQSTPSTRPSTPMSVTRPATPTRQLSRQNSGNNSARPATPTRQRSQTPTNSRPSTPTRSISTTPRRSNSGLFSIFSSSKGNNDEVRGTTPRKGAVFDFHEVDNNYPWSSWTNDGIVSSLHPLGVPTFLNVNAARNDSADYGSMKSVSSLGHSTQRSPHRSPEKKKVKQRKQLSLELTVENLQNHMSGDEDDTDYRGVQEKGRAQTPTKANKRSTPKSRGGNNTGFADSNSSSFRGSGKGSSKNGSAKGGSRKGSKSVPFQVVNADASGDAWDGYEDLIADSNVEKERRQQLQEALVKEDDLDPENLQAARESLAEKERNTMKALRMIDERVHEEKDGNVRHLRTHESFVRESDEVKKLLKARKDPEAYADYEEQKRFEAEARERERELAELRAEEEQRQHAEEERIIQEQKEKEAKERDEKLKVEAERKQAANRLQQSFVRNPNVLLNNRRRSNTPRTGVV